MKTSDTIDQIAGALAKAQADMERAKKDADNPHFKSKYADLASCWDACQGPLTKNGIAVVQANVPTEKGVTIQTRIVHSSGQWIQDDGLFVPADRLNAQGFGSAETYARRYALCAMVGIAPDEDDGNAAAANPGQQEPRQAAKKPASKPPVPEGMTTGDKTPTVVQQAEGMLERTTTVENASKALDWLEKKLVARSLKKDECDALCLALAAKVPDLCKTPDDCDAGLKLLTEMAGKMRIPDERAIDLKIKVSDFKESLAVPA